MQLTTQMQAEMKTIRKRIDLISEQVWIPLEADVTKRVRVTFDHIQTAHVVYAELNPYKVRLENMLCDTDCKEQAHSQ